MAHYFYGEDSFGAREAIQQLADESKANLRWLDKADLQQQSVADVVGQGGGLFGRQLVVIRDPSVLPKSLQEDIVRLVEGESQGAWVLWDRSKPDKRSKLWRACRPEAREFSPLSTAELTGWLIAYAERHGGAIADDAARLLIERIGSDRWRLTSEVDRLLLLDSRITTTTVAEHVDEPVSAEIFTALDALVGGNGATAMRAITVLLAQGASELYLLAMLAYQFRTLLVVQAGLAAGHSEREIVRLGKLHPFVVQKSVRPARALPRQFILDALTKIAATEFAIKQGRLEPRTGLEMLMVGLVSR